MIRHIPKPLRRLIAVYFTKRVSRSAAAFAFFFLESIFPLLIIISVMLGSLNIEVELLAFLLQDLIPEKILETLLNYLSSVSVNGSGAILVAGASTMILTSASAFRVIQTSMTDIMGKARFKGFFDAIFSFVFSIILLAVVYVSLIIVISGNWFISWLSGVLGINGLDFWGWFRFILMFLLLGAVLYIIYRLTAAPEKPRRQRIIGALTASAALVALSMVFSMFIGISAKYSLIYGSLASLVILMLWLYLCGNVLIMGNVLNLVINDWRDERLR